jgi:hypothetical protein
MQRACRRRATILCAQVTTSAGPPQHGGSFGFCDESAQVKAQCQRCSRLLSSTPFPPLLSSMPLHVVYRVTLRPRDMRSLHEHEQSDGSLNSFPMLDVLSNDNSDQIAKAPANQPSPQPPASSFTKGFLPFPRPLPHPPLPPPSSLLFRQQPRRIFLPAPSRLRPLHLGLLIQIQHRRSSRLNHRVRARVPCPHPNP